jgi:hypothetical protein
MTRTWGRINAAEHAALVIANLVGAWMVKDLSAERFQLVIEIGIGALILQLLALLFLMDPLEGSAYREINSWLHLGNGIMTLRRTPDLMSLFAHFTLVFIPTYIFAKFSQPLLVNAGISVTILGVVFSLTSVGSTLVAAKAGWFEGRFSRRGLMRGTALLIALGYVIALAGQHSPVFALLSVFFVALPMTLRWPVYVHLQNLYIPSASRATTMSLLSVIDSGFDAAILIGLSQYKEIDNYKTIMCCLVLTLIGLLFPVQEPGEPRNQDR